MPMENLASVSMMRAMQWAGIGYPQSTGSSSVQNPLPLPSRPLIIYRTSRAHKEADGQPAKTLRRANPPGRRGASKNGGVAQEDARAARTRQKAAQGSRGKAAARQRTANV